MLFLNEQQESEIIPDQYFCRSFEWSGEGRRRGLLGPSSPWPNENKSRSCRELSSTLSDFHQPGPNESCERKLSLNHSQDKIEQV